MIHFCIPEIKKAIGTVNFKIKVKIHLSMRETTAPPIVTPRVLFMNEMFKIVIQLKNLVQNIKRKLDKFPSRQEQI